MTSHKTKPNSTCASMTISATCLRYVDLPAMFGPVRSEKLEHSARCAMFHAQAAMPCKLNVCQGSKQQCPTTEVGVIRHKLEAGLRVLQERVAPRHYSQRPIRAQARTHVPGRHTSVTLESLSCATTEMKS